MGLGMESVRWRRDIAIYEQITARVCYADSGKECAKNMADGGYGFYLDEAVVLAENYLRSLVNQ